MIGRKGEILNVIVIGFHHKKGCQLEFSYPEVEKLPDQWKNLPSLAMPDGAHNYENDTVFFHLPSLTNASETIFGVSCFQQIPIEKVKKRSADMTRGTIQKAVCVLSTVPLYGYIQVKMELVTAAFFDEGDFSQVSLLKDAFHHLNDCLPDTYSHHILDGLSVRDLVQRFRHRTLLLFKMLLLERKVVFFHSPVKPLCRTLMSLVSLFPGLIQNGLYESSSACHESELYLSSSLSNEKDGIDEGIENSQCQENSMNVNVKLPCEAKVCDTNKLEKTSSLETAEGTAVNEVLIVNSNVSHEKEDEISEENLNTLETINNSFNSETESSEERVDEEMLLGVSTDECQEAISENCNLNCDIAFIDSFNPDDYDLPLPIFTNGNVCFPYLSISYLDYLSDPNVKGFCGGAANVLFKQKRQLIDVLVEIDNCKIETQCPELRRQLSLTTEDLRFSEVLVKTAIEAKEVGKYSVDEWIRAQFTLYLLSLLRTSLLEEGSKEIEHFNGHFISAWKDTHNYKMWVYQNNENILQLSPGHPSAGSLSVTDMRLHLSQAMSGSESGRKFNQAVLTTGKAVGGAISHAKGALSSWWSSMTTPEGQKTVKTVENI